MREALSESLHGAGFKVMDAESSPAAVDRLAGARYFRPDAVLTAIDHRDPAGSPLLAALTRQADRPPTVVVLANGNLDDRRHALRLGFSHLVLPPYDGEEVVLTTRLALEQHRDEGALSGSLGQMSAAELLQSAEVNRRSGTVVLRQGGRRGTVWLRDGRVIDAEIDDGRRREEAVYDLALWDRGTFEASFGAVDAPQRITASTTSLLLEAMRLRDEAAREAAPPHAALDDPPPPPPRRLLALHRALTLANLAASYACDHVDAGLLVRRMEKIQRRLAADHPVLTAFRLNHHGQVHVAADAPGLERIEARRVMQGVAAWLAELFAELDRALPGRFPLPKLKAISEAIQGDLSDLGFYRDLGLTAGTQGESTR
jgi:CheY-like chemotaxis protein